MKTITTALLVAVALYLLPSPVQGQLSVCNRMICIDAPAYCDNDFCQGPGQNCDNCATTIQYKQCQGTAFVPRKVCITVGCICLP